MHRDVKPGNFLITQSLDLMISDTGTARTLSSVSGMMSKTACAGTEAYWAPEQRTDFYTNKVDIWAYGSVLFELFLTFVDLGKSWPGRTGRPSFEFKGRVHPLVKLGMQCVDTDPNLRPTADEIFAGFCNGTYIDPALSDEEKGKLKNLIGTISEESDRILQARSRSTADALTAFRAAIVERSWTSACALLDRAREGYGEGLPVVELCALMFHHGIVFDRDDAAALRLLERGGERSEAIRKEIKEGSGSYGRGCVAQASGNEEEAISEFLKGIREERCVKCLVQLGDMLTRGGRVEEGERLLRIGANHGDLKAMFLLGLNLDGPESDALIDQAALLGHAGARAMKETMGCASRIAA
jgi:hypothetical protein